MKLMLTAAAAILLVSNAAAQDASVQFSSQASQGDWVVVDDVHLPAGGFVAIHDAQGPAPSSVLGRSTYLEAGNHTHVPVEISGLDEAATVFAVVHEDDGDQQFGYVSSDGQQDAPYTQDGRFVAAPGQVEPGDVASVAFDDQELGDTLTVRQVHVPSGGFVAIHSESFLDEAYVSSTIGTSDLLGPGSHTDVMVPIDLDNGGIFLAIVHRDSDGDGVYDFDISQGDVDPFYIDGSLPVLDRGGVRGAGGTVGAGIETEGEGNDSPAPAMVIALVMALALRRHAR